MPFDKFQERGLTWVGPREVPVSVHLHIPNWDVDLWGAQEDQQVQDNLSHLAVFEVWENFEVLLGPGGEGSE